MTGRLIGLLSPLAIMRLAVIPLLALVTLLTTGDGVHAAASFNPVNTQIYCAEGSGHINYADLSTAGIACTPDASVGGHPDIVSTFNIGLGPDGRPITGDDTGDYNFGGVVGLTPTVPSDTEIANGAILGELGSIAIIGVLNNTCTTRIDVKFTFLKASTDINDTVVPLPFGQANDLAIIAGDEAPFDGVATVNPPPGVTKYPSYLNAIFDPDWVNFGPDKISGNADDENGPAPPIKPVFRTMGVYSIRSAGNLWVVLNLVVFDKGTKLPNLPALDPGYGYPSVVVLQTASAAGSATSPAPSAVTDFCTPLVTANVAFGMSHDNPDTPANEGGVPIRTLPGPAAGAPDACQQTPPGPGCIVGFGYTPSSRDADGDGYENSLDTCPFHADTVWSPRDQTPPREGDTDVFVGAASPDGIPDTCDTTPTEPTTTGSQPTDHDGDGFPNSGDNCPLIANPTQDDKDKDANGEEVGDGIGDACDTPGTEGGTDEAGRPIPARSVAGKGPAVPDGEPILCVKVNTIVIGGDPNVAYSPCLAALPSLSGPLPATTTGGAQAGGGTTGSTTGGTTGGTTAGAGGPGGPVTGIGSLSPVAGTVPAWAAIAGAFGVAGMIGSVGTLASRLVKRRRDE